MQHMTEHAQPGTNADGSEGKPSEEPALLTVEQVRQLLNCSQRHLYRLIDRGFAPRATKLGALNRWPRATIEAWIQAGCPNCKRGWTP